MSLVFSVLAVVGSRGGVWVAECRLWPAGDSLLPGFTRSSVLRLPLGRCSSGASRGATDGKASSLLLYLRREQKMGKEGSRVDSVRERGGVDSVRERGGVDSKRERGGVDIKRKTESAQK